MKKQLLFLVMILLPMVASADAVEIDGIYYNLITKVKTAEVTSNPNYYTGSIVIPETVNYNNVTYSVTSIGSSAFYGCYSLTSVTIPNNVTSIGSNAFQNCSDLTSVTIPNSVTSIGNSAFYQCFGLTSVTIGSGVTSIGDGAFHSCSGLTSITIPNSVTSIGGAAFGGCSGLTSITIPNSVTSIGGSAFSGCSGLTSITIPNSVTSIVYNAFYECSGLTSITIPNSVTSIDSDAFYGCTGLTSVTIGSGISSIEFRAFAKCPNLTDVFCYAENVPNTRSDAFSDSYIEYATLHVPAASINAYNAAEPWKNFKSIVAADGETPETQKCENPVISYENGKLSFSCATEGVEFVSEIVSDDIKKHYGNEVSLTTTYTVSVYATKAGYENSDVVTKNITFSSNQAGDLNGDGEINITDVTLVLDIINQQ